MSILGYYSLIIFIIRVIIILGLSLASFRYHQYYGFVLLHCIHSILFCFSFFLFVLCVILFMYLFLTVIWRFSLFGFAILHNYLFVEVNFHFT